MAVRILTIISSWDSCQWGTWSRWKLSRPRCATSASVRSESHHPQGFLPRSSTEYIICLKHNDNVPENSNPAKLAAAWDSSQQGQYCPSAMRAAASQCSEESGEKVQRQVSERIQWHIPEGSSSAQSWTKAPASGLKCAKKCPPSRVGILYAATYSTTVMEVIWGLTPSYQ